MSDWGGGKDERYAGGVGARLMGRVEVCTREVRACVHKREAGVGGWLVHM